jgi:endonuclease YncB( thermonuclease family)
MHEPGLILTDLQLERVIDADTIELSITRKFKVRLRNVDAPEKNTDEGYNATQFVHSLFLLHSPPEIACFIPSNNPEQFLDFNSFNRIVADLIVNGFDVAESLKKLGFNKNEP